MSNTKVTIEYPNGETREFVASDELEKSINEGEMFSVTTMHSDISREEEIALSKMYVGNPIAAMGHMMMMHRNAKHLEHDDKGHREVVLEILATCIAFMKEEITSHQSGLTSINGETFTVHEQTLSLVENDPTDCPVTGDHCDHYAYEYVDGTVDTDKSICEHPENSSHEEGNCTSVLCPLSTGDGD